MQKTRMNWTDSVLQGFHYISMKFSVQFYQIKYNTKLAFISSFPYKTWQTERVNVTQNVTRSSNRKFGSSTLI